MLDRLFRSSAPAQQLTVAVFPPPVRRGWWTARWSARRALAGAMRLDEHLACSIAQHTVGQPAFWVPLLPVIEGGAPKLVSNPEPDPIAAVLDGPADVVLPPAASADAAVSIARFVRAQREVLAWMMERDMGEATEEENAANARFADAMEVLEERRTALQQAITNGAVLPPATERRPPEQRLRPRTGFAWMRAFFVIGELVAIASEGFAFLGPLLDRSGIALGPNRGLGSVPLEVLALAGGMAFGSAALAFIGATRVEELLATPDGRDAKGRLRWGALLAWGGLVTAVLGAMAMLRDGLASAVVEKDAALASHAAFYALTFAFPFLVAGLRHWVRKDDERRETVRQLQATFDRAEELARAMRERLEHSVATSMGEVAEAERRREAARARFRALAERAQQEEARLRTEHEARRAWGTAWARSVLAALEVDRLAFRIVAVKAGRDDLLQIPPVTYRETSSGVFRLAVRPTEAICEVASDLPESGRPPLDTVQWRQR